MNSPSLRFSHSFVIQLKVLFLAAFFLSSRSQQKLAGTWNKMEHYQCSTHKKRNQRLVQTFSPVRPSVWVERNGTVLQGLQQSAESTPCLRSCFSVDLILIPSSSILDFHLAYESEQNEVTLDWWKVWPLRWQGTLL